MNKFRKIIFILIIVLLGVIFFFSSRQGNVSNQDSYEVGVTVVEKFLSISGNYSEEEIQQFVLKNNYTIRKIAHMVEYFILAVLVSLVYGSPKKEGFKRVLVPVLITLTFAVVDEVHQLYVPGRDCKVSDVLIDGIGIILGVLACILIGELIKRVKKKN